MVPVESASAAPASQAGMTMRGTYRDVPAGFPEEERHQEAGSFVNGEEAGARFDLPLEIFCPECQGTGRRAADGSLEHPRYRLSQVRPILLPLQLMLMLVLLLRSC